MTKSTSPSTSPSTRLIGIELRDWRLRRGKSGDQAAATTRVSPSLISRMENGHRPPDPDCLRLLMNLYQVPAAERDRLQLIRDAAAAEHLGGDRLDQDLVTEILAWAPLTVPEALTTELYARAVTKSLRRVRRYTPSEMKRQARAGAAWQPRLRGEADNPDSPPEVLELSCVLSEAVLHQRRGATSAMVSQLDLLAQLAALDTVDLRVLPFDADGPAFGPYTLYSYGNEDLTDVVLLEGPAGTERIIDERTVTDYRLAFEELMAVVPDRDTSAVMIKQAAGHWA
jgi:transcriptional regulator with XRE-family HTH domain